MMKNNIERFYEDSIEKWRINAGVGTMLLDKNTDYKPIVLGIIQRIYNKSPTTRSTIIVKNFIERTNLLEYLISTDDEENNNEIRKIINNKYLKILTSDFIKNNFVTRGNLCIIVNEDSINKATLDYISECNFKLTILFNYLTNSEDRVRLYKHCPILHDFTQQEIQQLRSTHPVEETLIGVNVDDTKVVDILQQCDKFISQSINIFGSFDNTLKARLGDSNLNISAMQICNRIAEENGWNDSLDMNIPINVAIDEMYNPNALYERASQLSSVIKERSKILSDYNGKLETIRELVEKHLGSRIIVINKRGEFANKVTDYLNNTIEKFGYVCGNCHDKAEPIEAYDDNGIPILVKSGENKGKIKVIKAKAQYTQNLKRFMNEQLDVLSFSNMPDKDTECSIDVVIITSPMCLTIDNYIYRLSKVRLNSNPLIVYNIYCKNTIEEKLLQKLQPTPNHKIVNKSEIMSDFNINTDNFFVE